MTTFGSPVPHVKTSIDGVPVAPMSETQIGELQQRISDVRGLELPKLHNAEDPHSRLYVMALDGTQNDAINDPEHITNIGLINKVVKNSPDTHITSEYTKGVGNQPFVSGIADSALGLTVENQARDAYNKFVAQANAWHLKDNDTKISVAGVGFSRGSTALLVASNMVHEKGIPDFSKPEQETFTDPKTGSSHERTIHPHYIIPPGQVKQALILNDQVATGKSEDLNRSVPPSVVSVVQIKAENEYREQFPFYDAQAPQHPDPRIITLPFPGAHSDVGGGYKLNGISSNTLLANEIILNKWGAGLAESKPESDPAKYVIHDSEYLWNDRHLNSPMPELATRPTRKEVALAQPEPKEPSHRTTWQEHIRGALSELSPEQQSTFLARIQENLSALQAPQVEAAAVR